MKKYYVQFLYQKTNRYNTLNSFSNKELAENYKQNKESEYPNHEFRIIEK